MSDAFTFFNYKGYNKHSTIIPDILDDKSFIMTAP